jgi:dehydrogenase/reductase SDR family protein 12
MVDAIVDTVLDRTVVGGYTNVGYRIRSRAWSASDLQRMDGKVVAITGANSGIGFAAAHAYARLGATVWLVVRDRARGERAGAEITAATGNADIHVGVCDLSTLASIRSFAGRFPGRAGRLDVLVNNAGAMTETRELSADGIELTLATNVIGPFALTTRLIELLRDSAPARIINVSSGGMYTQRLRVEDLQNAYGRFDGAAVYARSKRAEVVLSEIWAQRLAGTGVTVHAMHPGWVDTPGIQTSLPRFYRVTRPLLRTPAEGADTIVWLGAAAEPALRSGLFWHDRRPRPVHLLPRTRETAAGRASLWAQCAELSGVPADAAEPTPAASS